MAIIGFIFLLVVGAVFFLGAVLVLLVGGSLGGGSSTAEGLVPLILGGLILWAAFHFAPFSVHFTGA